MSVVIPVYDEAESLRPLFMELTEALGASVAEWELIFVDDGSRDGSLAVMRELALAHPGVRVLHSPVNRGQSAALLAGFAAVRGEIVVTLDADLQNDPADIPRLLVALEGYDAVSGVRTRRRDGWTRRLSSRLANGVRRAVLHDGITDVGCSLKAYRSRFLAELPAFHGMHRFLPALVILQGGRVREIAVGHRPRRFGRSKYGIRNRLLRGLQDLAGVRWLQGRWLGAAPVIEEGIRPGGAAAAGGQVSPPSPSYAPPCERRMRRERRP